jgi:hypothetical protein
MPRIEPMDTSSKGLEDVAKFLREVFPQARYLDAEFLNWLYMQCPMEPRVLLNAYDRENLIGHMAFLPYPANVQGKKDLGVLGVHLAAPRRPGLSRSPAVELYTEGMKQSRLAGANFLCGVTNARSSRFTKRAFPLFEEVGPLAARIGILAPNLSRSTREVSFDRIWNNESLAWRLARPGRPYRLERSRGGFRVHGPTHRAGIKVEMGYFPTDLVPPDLPDVHRPHPLRLWLGLEPRVNWSRSLYLPIPQRFRPSPLVFMFLDLTDQGRVLGDASRVRIRALDFDAF